MDEQLDEQSDELLYKMTPAYSRLLTNPHRFKDVLCALQSDIRRNKKVGVLASLVNVILEKQ